MRPIACLLRHLRLFRAFPVLLLLAACATVPGTGRNQLMLVDDQQASQLGVGQFEQMKRELPISQNPEHTDLVKEVGRRIAGVVDLPGETEWEFVVFDDDTPNAFALPGGKVGVFTGLLKVADNDDQLAAVVGHEIAHVVARHGSERMSQGLLVQLGGQVLEAAMQSQPGTTQGLAMAAYGLGSQVGVLLPYSRKHELEADHLGMLYMARAGYDPREAVEFWKRFAEYGKGGDQPPEFLSTHPLDETRIQELEAILPEALEAYREANGGV